MEVIIRPFQKTDEPFIFSSWTKNHCYSSKELKKEHKKHPAKKREWFREKCKQITEILAMGHVRIACLVEDPNVIVGYCVFLRGHFEFSYVKEDYREPQILELLIKGDPYGNRKED
jgi:hypothetical protein